MIKRSVSFFDFISMASYNRNYFPFHCPWTYIGVLQVKEVAPEARRRNAKLSFALVYPDRHGRFVVREVSLSLYACIHIFVISGWYIGKYIHDSSPFYLVECSKIQPTKHSKYVHDNTRSSTRKHCYKFKQQSPNNRPHKTSQTNAYNSHKNRYSWK